MPLLDLQKLTVGLSRTWAGYLRDWDRSLRSGNYPETTRYNYLLAAGQLARGVSVVGDRDSLGVDGVEQAQGFAAVLQVADARRGGNRSFADGTGEAAEDDEEADPDHREQRHDQSPRH